MMAKRNKGVSSLPDAESVDVSKLKEKLHGLVKMMLDDDDFTIETTDEAIATISLLKDLKKKNPSNEGHVSQLSPPLPIEIITEILLWLPVRSLLQFRSVCKLWNSMISDTQFAKLHLSRSSTHPTLNHHRLLLLNPRAIPTPLISCSVKSLFNDPFTPVEDVNVRFDILIGTCNGIICLYNSISMCVQLCNPSTRLKSRESPPVGYKPTPYYAGLYYYGFGHDHVSDKYKVVLTFNDPRGPVTKLYTFGDSCWRTIQNLSYIGHSTNMSGCFVSGNLNWAVKDFRDHSSAIYFFDLEKETFGKFPLPDFGHNTLVIANHTAMKNSLCVYYNLEGYHSVVWIMKEYGVKESWTKLTVIPHMELQLVVGPHNVFVEPLCVSERSQVLLNCTSSNNIRMAVYNPKDDLFTYPNIQWNTGWYTQKHIYLESLLSPCF